MRTVLCFFVLAFAWYTLYAQTDYTVTGEGVNIRSDSTITAISLGRLTRGQRVSALGEKYGWLKIILPPQIPCYVKTEYTQTTEEPGTLRIIKPNVNLRSGPSFDALIIGTLPRDATLKLFEAGAEWTTVNAHPYACGWVHKKFFTLSDAVDSSLSVAPASEIIVHLSEPSISQKQPYHQALAQKGKEIIPFLEPLMESADAATVYSIISVLSEFARDDAEVLANFLVKARAAPARSQAAYLDIIQDSIAAQDDKMPFFFLVEQGRLNPEDALQRLEFFNQRYQARLGSSDAFPDPQGSP